MGRWDDKTEIAARRWESWRPQDYAITDRVLTDVIKDKARRRPNHVAFQFRNCGISLGELVETWRRVATGLQKVGVSHGDKVAIMLPNCPEFLYSWFGANEIGAVEVPINTALRGEGLAYQVDHSEAKVLIVHADYAARIQQVADRLPKLQTIVRVGAPAFDMPGIETISFNELNSFPVHLPDINVSYRDLASILYTSGTTGRSKGVMISHHYWYDIWREAVNYARYTDLDILYSGLPLFHGNAQGLTVGSSIMADASAVIVERFSASRFWNDCRQWECTAANYIGSMLPILLKNDETPDDADNPVRLMLGAAAPQRQWEEFQKRFQTKLLEVYGMTECYCCLASPFDAPRPGSCGKAITGWDVRIVDENDMELPPGEVGEFIARSNRMWVGTAGYHRNPEATLDMLQNGWIHTGDLGRRDEEGYFYFEDRKKQALRRRGENISSFEVESVISSHQAVLESCVVGVPSDMGEEEVKAVVVLKPGQNATEEDIIHWCAERMAYFAVPRYVAFRPDLPKTPSERVEKYKLKAEGVTADCWDREKAGIQLER